MEKLEKKMLALESQRKKLAALEAAILAAQAAMEAEKSAGAAAQLIHDTLLSLLGEVQGRFVVDFTPTGVTVARGAASKGNGNGKGAFNPLPDGGVERTYKGSTYRLEPSGDSFKVTWPSGEITEHASATAAAAAVLESCGSNPHVNGRDWWGLNG